MEAPSLRSASARRFDSVLSTNGLTGRVVELPDSTRTAVDAAKAVGCEPRQIVKSLVFQGRSTGNPYLLLVSGANRVDEPWMARYVGEHLARAHPEFARAATGFAIGGVPPAGHLTAIPTFIDYDLLELPEVWAAAGHPHAVCRLTSTELLHLTRGRPVPVTPVPPAENPSTRWVTFDCYGTLVDWQAGFRRSVREMRLEQTEAGAERLFRRYLEEEPAVEREAYRPYREVMAETLRRVVRSEGLEFGSALADQIPAAVSAWPLFPDVPATFARLRELGYRIGVLSNIERETLARTLAQGGLTVDCCVTAEEVHSYKPAPPHWIRFFREARTEPSRVAHVSSSYDYDLETGRRLGCRTVHVNRYGPLGPGQSADEVVGGLGELPAVLEQASASTPATSR